MGLLLEYIYQKLTFKADECSKHMLIAALVLDCPDPKPIVKNEESKIPPRTVTIRRFLSPILNFTQLGFMTYNILKYAIPRLPIVKLLTMNVEA